MSDEPVIEGEYEPPQPSWSAPEDNTPPDVEDVEGEYEPPPPGRS